MGVSYATQNPDYLRISKYESPGEVALPLSVSGFQIGCMKVFQYLLSLS